MTGFYFCVGINIDLVFVFGPNIISFNQIHLVFVGGPEMTWSCVGIEIDLLLCAWSKSK